MEKDLSPLTKKLACYSAMAGSLLAANSQQAHAQVIYHDLDPDVIINDSVSYYLDLNNDSIADFLLSPHAPYGYGSVGVIVPLSTYGLVMATQIGYVDALDSCEVISSSPPGNNSWSNSYAPMLLSWNGTAGISPWLNADYRFAAVMFHLADGNHYGWIRMSHSALADSVIIHDYAYESTPDSAILACLIATHPIDPAVSSFSAAVENHQLFIRLQAATKPFHVRVLNEVGMIMTERIAQSTLMLNVSSYSPGIYLVVVENGEQREVKKVLIE